MGGCEKDIYQLHSKDGTIDLNPENLGMKATPQMLQESKVTIRRVAKAERRKFRSFKLR